MRLILFFLFLSFVKRYNILTHEKTIYDYDVPACDGGKL